MKLSTLVWEPIKNHGNFIFLGLSLIFGYWTLTEPAFIFGPSSFTLKKEQDLIGEVTETKNQVRLQAPNELVWSSETSIHEGTKLLTQEHSSAFVTLHGKTPQTGMGIEIGPNTLIELKKTKEQDTPQLTLFRGSIKRSAQSSAALSIRIQLGKGETVEAQVSDGAEFELRVEPDPDNGKKLTSVVVTAGKIDLIQNKKHIQLKESQKTTLSSDPSISPTILEVPFKLLSPKMNQAFETPSPGPIDFSWEVISEAVAAEMTASPQLLEFSATSDFKKILKTVVIPGSSPTLRKPFAKVSLADLKLKAVFWRISAHKNRWVSPSYRLVLPPLPVEPSKTVEPAKTVDPIKTPSAPAELDEPEIEGKRRSPSREFQIASNDYLPSIPTPKIYVKLRWSEAKDAKNYILELSEDKLFNGETERYTVDTRTFKWETDPSPLDRTFYYRVATQTAEGAISEFSKPKEFRIPGRVLTPKAELTAITPAQPEIQAETIAQLDAHGPIETKNFAFALAYGIGIRNRSQSTSESDLTQVSQNTPALGIQARLNLHHPSFRTEFIYSAQNFSKNLESPPITPKTQTSQTIRKAILGGFKPVSPTFWVGAVAILDSRWVKSASQTVEAKSGSSFGPALEFVKEWNHEVIWAPVQWEWFCAIPLTGVLHSGSFGIETGGWTRWSLFNLGKNARIELSWGLSLSYSKWRTPASTSVLSWDTTLNPSFTYRF